MFCGRRVDAYTPLGVYPMRTEPNPNNASIESILWRGLVLQGRSLTSSTLPTSQGACDVAWRTLCARATLQALLGAGPVALPRPIQLREMKTPLRYWM
jgi:hypothetical protein